MILLPSNRQAFCKGPDSKYSRLYKPCGVSVAVSSLSLPQLPARANAAVQDTHTEDEAALLGKSPLGRWWLLGLTEAVGLRGPWRLPDPGTKEAVSER